MSTIVTICIHAHISGIDHSCQFCSVHNAFHIMQHMHCTHNTSHTAKHTNKSANFAAHFTHGRKTESPNVHSFSQLTEPVSPSYITQKNTQTACLHLDKHTRTAETHSGNTKPIYWHTHVQHVCLPLTAIVCSVSSDAGPHGLTCYLH